MMGGNLGLALAGPGQARFLEESLKGILKEPSLAGPGQARLDPVKSNRILIISRNFNNLMEIW